MAKPTIVAERSPLFQTQLKGRIPAVTDGMPKTGNVFYVMPGGSDTAGVGETPDNPFATIDFAIGQCEANQGDTILVMPGYTQDITGAAGIAQDVAGVAIIGLGHGGARPTITFTATGSTWAISVANCTVKNIRTTCTGTTTKMFHITAAGVTLDAVDYFEGSAIPLQFILTTNAADQLTVKNCFHHGPTAGASAQLWIRLIGCDNPRILNNSFYMDLRDDATSAIVSADGSVVWAEVGHNNILVTGGTTIVSVILFTNGATGMVHHNNCPSPVTTLLGIVDVGTGAYAIENYALNTADKSGLLAPAVE